MSPLTKISPMEELKQITLAELFDMLVDQTSKYLDMVHQHGNREDLQICREIMTAIQIEIERRKSKNNIDTLVNPQQNQEILETTE
jgi:hypothetical protein